MTFSKITFRDSRLKIFAALGASFLLTVGACRSSEPRIEYMEIAAGERFRLDLPASNASKYSWVWTNKDEVDKVDFVGVIHEVVKTRSAGEMGIEIWSFDALETGEDLLILEYINDSLPTEIQETRYYELVIQ